MVAIGTAKDWWDFVKADRAHLLYWPDKSEYKLNIKQIIKKWNPLLQYFFLLLLLYFSIELSEKLDMITVDLSYIS